MQSVMEAIVTLTVQVTTITIQVKNLTTATGNDATTTTTVLTFAMTPGQLKIEQFIDYNDKVDISL